MFSQAQPHRVHSAKTRLSLDVLFLAFKNLQIKPMSSILFHELSPLLREGSAGITWLKRKDRDNSYPTLGTLRIHDGDGDGDGDNDA